MKAFGPLALALALSAGAPFTSQAEVVAPHGHGPGHVAAPYHHGHEGRGFGHGFHGHPQGRYFIGPDMSGLGAPTPAPPPEETLREVAEAAPAEEPVAAPVPAFTPAAPPRHAVPCACPRVIVVGENEPVRPSRGLPVIIYGSQRQ